jgi:hypothetical protein
MTWGTAMDRASKDVAGVPKARESDADELPDPSPPPPEPPAESTEDTLAERERAILDFEKQWWRHAGAKEQAVRDTFSLSPTRYYQLLNALLERPAALAYDPALVKRLRRVRASRLRRRT